ncbi:MAG: hypothetical protein SFU98_06610 [Leptospiraceae bacterium]|nr:hypothetical protein [Leptospiraceae bacterium]
MFQSKQYHHVFLIKEKKNPKNRNYIETRRKSELDKNVSLIQAQKEGI